MNTSDATQTKKLTLSLIIPAYNEERHIKSCLDAVAKQSVMPNEVILVDNNCTDSTIEIAKRYPFVTIIKENKQGRAHARNAGFEYAKGEIIGRIDVDSILSTTWVETVLYSFNQDAELQGITGIAKTDFLPFVHIKSTIYPRAYFWFAHSGFNTITMWGANMAVRRTAWEIVKNDVCNDDRLVHEDQDISICMASRGLKIEQNNSLIITTNGQTYRYLPKLFHYGRLYESTKRLHRKNGNLTNPRIRKIGRIQSVFGRSMALLFGFIHIAQSIFTFPIDIVAIRIFNRENWLD